METYKLIGIVNGIEAVRGRNDDVLHLEANIRIRHPFSTRYEETVTTKWILPVVVSDEIRAGDVVTIAIETHSPMTPRFANALPVGGDDD